MEYDKNLNKQLLKWQKKFLLFRSYATQRCWVASLAEVVAVLLMQFPMLVRPGILNLFMVPAIAHLLFTKDTVVIACQSITLGAMSVAS